MNNQISTKSAAVGAGLLLIAAVGATVALNSTAASGAVPQAKANVHAAVAGLTSKVSIYMKVPGITGSATTKGLAGWEPITNVSGGFQMPTSLGQATGRVAAANISLEKAVDLATPQLLTDLTTAKSLSPVEIKVFQADVTGAPKLVTDYSLTHALVVSDTFAQGPAGQIEKVQFVYQSIKMTQTQPGKTGSQIFQWDQAPLG